MQSSAQKRSWTNSNNRFNGDLLERFVLISCDWYRDRNIAHIKKTPEPLKVVGKMQNKHFPCVFTEKAQCDYKGTLAGGRSIVFDAKFTTDDKITRNTLSDEQMLDLGHHHQLGAQCYILVSLKMDSFYFVPWAVWRDMKKIYGRVHMKKDDLKEFRVKFINSRIEFLHSFEKWTNREDVN